MISIDIFAKHAGMHSGVTQYLVVGFYRIAASKNFQVVAPCSL
jgi:hypothetical protein